MLFFVHSDLEESMPTVAREIERWFLSSFLFVAAYLTSGSFNRMGQKTGEFLRHRLSAVYLPYVMIMGFYVMTDRKLDYSWLGFLSHSMIVLPLFAVFTEGVYAMYQFWFVPILLDLTILFVLLDKYVKNGLACFLILIGLFALNLVNWMYNTGLRFNWNFGFYLFVFTAGYMMAKRNWLKRVRDPRIISFSVAIAITVQYVYVRLTPDWDYVSPPGRAIFLSYSWTESTVFSLSTIVPLLALLFFLRQRFAASKIYTITGVLASCSLLIYLWEGYVSPRISLYVFGTYEYYELSGNMMLLSIPVRLVTVTIVAFATSKIQKATGGRIIRWQGSAHIGKPSTLDAHAHPVCDVIGSVEGGRSRPGNEPLRLGIRGQCL